MQWPRNERGKHIPVARQLQQLDYNNRRAVFSARSLQRGYEEDSWGDPVSLMLSFVREGVKISSERVNLKNLHC
jgi:hypothetical protein